MKKKFFAKHPKWRFGSFSALMMALLIAAMVLVNLGVSLLETRYGWQRDYSFNGLITQSETTKKVMASLPYPVHIYALYTAGSESLTLKELLNRYQTGSPLITYEMLELNKNPGLLSKFKSTTEDSLAADSLIIDCQTTGRYKILSPSSFYSVGYSIENGTYEVELAYEKQITEALLYVTRDEIPVIQLLDGHGELSGDVVSTLTDVLTSNNYKVETVNLRSGGTLTEDALLMILSPTEDLRTDELAQITTFTKAGGALFITCDFTNPIDSMPNYASLLRSYGMVPLTGVVVSSTDEPATYYDSPLNLIPTMEMTGPTQSLMETGLNELLMPGARAFQAPDTTDPDLTVTPVLTSGSKAYLRDISDENISLKQLEGDPTGPFDVALLGSRTQADGTVSRAFIAGSSALFTESQVYALTSNHNLELLLRMCEHLLDQAPISLDIVAKPSVRPGLSASAQGPGLMMVFLLPLGILVAALAVLVPRRHR